ncbi:hypothetical protein ES705_50435 [subsurface metagenome]
MSDLSKQKRMTDAAGYSMTLQEIAAYITKHNVSCSCGYTFRESDIRSYNHPLGGIGVLGYPQKQWVYFYCPSCTCDLALTHIQIEVISS